MLPVWLAGAGCYMGESADSVAVSKDDEYRRKRPTAAPAVWTTLSGTMSSVVRQHKAGLRVPHS
jgi:hypothetical protein